MRLILMWANNDPEMKLLIGELESAGHEIVYWVGLNGGEHMCPRGAIFHDHYDAREGLPAMELRHEHFKPASLDQIEEMYRTESLVLTMYNKGHNSAPVDLRKQMYYDQLAYWSEIFERVKPDALVLPNAPHSVYNFVAYMLAKKKGLKTIMFEDTWVGGRMIWFSDYEIGSDAWTESLARNKGKKFTLEDLDPLLQTYYKSQTGESQIKPAYMLAQKDTGEGWPLFTHRIRIVVRNITNGKTPALVWGFILRQFKNDLRKEYKEVTSSPDFKKPFIYFPLGYQPERTTSPQGDIYHDQILAVQTLAAALPEGWEVYVKEHPSQWWLGSKTMFSSARYSGYYECLAAIPNVRVVPIHTDTHTLIDRAETVATITGTAAWESLFRFKRPIVFGYPWYVNVPSILRVRSIEDCAKAIETVRSGDRMDASELFWILKSFEESSMIAFGYGMNGHSQHYFDVKADPMETMGATARLVRKLLA